MNRDELIPKELEDLEDFEEFEIFYGFNKDEINDSNEIELKELNF
jgi:hypothetical protein